MKKPQALLVIPPIYDFALYDLFLKPYGLLKIGKRFYRAGYEIHVLNYLDYYDQYSIEKWGKPKRKKDGTGKFFRRKIETPKALYGIERSFARYGIHPDSAQQQLCRIKPDIILLTTGMTYWYWGVREAAQTVRKLFPSVPLLVGGVYAILMPEHCKKVTETDYVISDSDIATINDVLTNIGLPLIPQFSNSSGAVESQDANPSSQNPILHEEYLYGNEDIHGDTIRKLSLIWKDAGIIRLNTGCPFHCEYCASKALNKVFRYGNPSQACKQIETLYSLYRTRHFAFYDDALLVRKEKSFLPFIRMVLERFGDRNGFPLRFYVPNALHIRLIDPEIARLMKLSHFQEIRLGYESASNEFHNQYDDKFFESDFTTAIRNLLEAGFARQHIGVYVLAGLPEQRAGDVEHSIQRAASMGVRVYLSEYSPVPVSALWEKSSRLSRYNLEDEPLYHNNTVFPLEWNGFTRDDMQRLKDLTKTLSRSG